MGNSTTTTTVAAVVETNEVEAPKTLEAAIAKLSDKEKAELILNPAKLKALKATVAKPEGHKESLQRLLKTGPKTVVELAKAMGTTVKTVQSYVCYAKNDGKQIVMIAGRYTLLETLSPEVKKALGLK